MNFRSPEDTKGIIKIIDRLKRNASAGHDNVKIKLIKNLYLTIAICIAKLINKKIKQHTFTDEFKNCKSYTLFKNGKGIRQQ